MSGDVLGVGFRFPLLPERGFPVVTGPDVVAQAIRAILLTNPGERIGRPTYGAGLGRFLFAPNTVTTRTMIQEAVLGAIRRDEPRVAQLVVDVLTVSGEPTRLDIDVRYTLHNQSTIQNLVYPFYLRVGEP